MGETPIQQIHRLPPTMIGVGQTATMELPFVTTISKKVVVPIVRVLTINEQKGLQQNKGLLEQKPLVLLRQPQLEQAKVLEKELQRVSEKELQKVLILQKQVQLEKQVQKQVEKSVQKTALAKAIVMTTPFTPMTPPTITPPPTIIPFIEPPFTSKIKISKGMKAKLKAYQLFIKEKGQYKAIGKAQPRGKAIKLGATITKQRLSSTFKVAPTKQEVSGFDINFQPSPQEFRSYKIVKGKQVPMQDTWIELRTKRLTTRGEKQAFKIAKRQKGGKNWL
jgi:hypothetical protein